MAALPRITCARADARRRQIVEAALICFARRGFHKTTMQDVVKQSGLSPGSIYCHFAGKKDIIVAVVEERHRRERALLQRALEKQSFAEAVDHAAVAAAGAAKRRANRGALPVHLPRVDVTIEPDDTNCPCCRAPMHVIGEETSQRLDVVPAQFRVIVTHRPKYACRACEQAVVVAPAPERLIKGGLPTEAMVASVLVAKYAWHLPLYRQAQMLLAQGLDIKRGSSPSGWAMRPPS